MPSSSFLDALRQQCIDIVVIMYIDFHTDFFSMKCHVSHEWFHVQYYLENLAMRTHILPRKLFIKTHFLSAKFSRPLLVANLYNARGSVMSPNIGWNKLTKLSYHLSSCVAAHAADCENFSAQDVDMSAELAVALTNLSLESGLLSTNIELR